MMQQTYKIACDGKFPIRSIWLLVAVGSVCLCTAAAQAQVPLPESVFLDTDPGTGPEDRNVPFLAWHEDLSVDGYVEREYQLSGLANTYAYTDNAAQSPEVQVAIANQPYITRILVRRPNSAQKFNGVIYLEILNATARYDGAPMWNLTYKSIMAEGAAWVGLTYSDTTANFMRDTWGTANFPAPAGAQPRDNSRYAYLNITTRAHTWDMLNQAAALLKATGQPGNPMGDWPVNVIIITGYSQSAAYVVTQANSFYPRYSEADPAGPCDPLQDPETGSCSPVVDGFLIAAGGPQGRLMDGAGSHPIGDKRNFSLARAKTMRFTTESDIKSVRVRYSYASPPSAEPEKLRTYEVAGTSHVDYWGSVVGQAVAEYQFGITGSVGSGCDLPLNPLRDSSPLSAIQYRLARWIEFGEEPPPSDFIDFEGSFDNDTAAWVRDSAGNVTGGVRPARIEVPLGTYSGTNPYSGPTPSTTEIFCREIIGSFVAFDESELIRRYGNRMRFVILTWWNLWRSYVEGFLLAVDAKVIMDEARTFDGLPE